MGNRWPPAGSTGAWERVEALYDYALEHIKYQEGAEDKSSVADLFSVKA